MDKAIVTTYLFSVCCMNIYGEEIRFHDYNTNETVCIDGVEQDQLQQAIRHYVHNLGVDKESKEWLRKLQAEVSSSLALLEAETND